MSGDAHLLAGWAGILLGVVSGAAMGLFFYREDWMGGYASFRRRLARLGHIAFFGIGFLNVFYGLTEPRLELGGAGKALASIGFLVSLATMSPVCFLTAWKRNLRHLFPIPVAGALLGIVVTVVGLA